MRHYTDHPRMGYDDPEDGRHGEADRFLRDLDALLLDNRLRYARATLEAIYDTVSRTGEVTDRQRRAVVNICSGWR